VDRTFNGDERMAYETRYHVVCVEKNWLDDDGYITAIYSKDFNNVRAYPHSNASVAIDFNTHMQDYSWF
jgi:hypothetical protein